MNTALKAIIVGLLGLGLGFGSGWAWDAATGSTEAGSSAPDTAPTTTQDAAVTSVSTGG